MKQVHLLLFMLLLGSVAYSQLTPVRQTEFVFSNSLGDTDTFTIAFDQFIVYRPCMFEDYGFDNYYNQLLEPTLDIRHSPNGLYGPPIENDTCSSKSKIFPVAGLNSNQYYDIHGIFYSRTDTITISWDSTFFLNNLDVEASYLHFNEVNFNYPYTTGPTVFLSSRSSLTISYSDIGVFEQNFSDGIIRDVSFYSIALAPDTLFSSVQELQEIDANIYPSIIEDRFEIVTDEHLRVELIDMNGSFIQIEKLSESEYLIPQHISRGVYIIRLITEDGFQDSRKIAKF